MVKEDNITVNKISIQSKEIYLVTYKITYLVKGDPEFKSRHPKPEFSGH